MKINKTIVSLLLMTFTMSVVAQNRPYYDERYLQYNFVEQKLQKMSEDLAHSKDKRVVLPMKDYLLSGSTTCWTDGVEIITTLYFDDERYFDTNKIVPPGVEVVDYDRVPEFVARGGKVTIKGKPGIKVSVERIGNYVMLVERNAAGVPIKCYYNMTDEEMNRGMIFEYHQNLLYGNYSIPGDHNVVFGPKQEYYEGYKYDYDPGWCMSYINPDFKSIDIVYGAGRVSHGDPDSPGYKANMPGGGGAGALMGPMEWRAVVCKEGMKLTVLTDEKFVDHSPRLPEGETLATKIQCPYEGLDGKWTFASVVPLTPDILKIFPKEVLTLMRGEIYARHGDTFSNPDTQRYFNAQPWYKKSNKPVALTDLERFNYSVIKYAESLK